VASESEWRLRARRVIVPILDGLSVPLCEKGMRAAVKDAYPFGLREHWPYKMWCKELREQIKRRCKVPEERPEVRFVVILYGYETSPSPWLEVSCGWCLTVVPPSSHFTGCMMCAAHRRTILAVVALPQWRQWKQQVREDAANLHILADWLTEEAPRFIGDEHAGLLEVLAEALRLEVMKCHEPVGGGK
jgi:hypothetical protein